MVPPLHLAHIIRMRHLWYTVEPMGKECEMVSVLALAEAFGVQVSVEYLDGRALVNDKLARHTFGPESAKIRLEFLYRPGHYDVLYPKETATTTDTSKSSS